MSKYDIESIRSKLKSKSGGRFKDPNEFKPNQPKEGETFKYRFFVLPPLAAGDACAEGKASRSMELFYATNGSHWINNKPTACLRVHDEETCPLCQFAFDLIQDAGDDKKKKSMIAKTYLPRTQYAMNIYFLNTEANPEELRGKVMWYNPSKQVYDIMEKCLYNDNPGDDIAPEACGVFYDENAAYIFQLECTRDEHGYISYKTSKFLAAGGPRPIVAKKDAEGNVLPATDKIEQLLAQRFDLFTKFEGRSTTALADVVKRIMNEDTSAADAGFDQDEVEAPKAPVTAKKQAPPVSDDIMNEEPVVVKPKAPVSKAPAPAPAKAEAAAASDEVSEEELEKLLGEID